MKMSITAAACASCFLGASALAADSGFYFGVLGGGANYEFEDLRIPVATPSFGGSPSTVPPFGWLSDVPAAVISTDVYSGTAFMPAGWLPGSDDESTSWGITAGYRIFRYAAVELNYLSLGTLEESETINIYPPPGTAQLHRELETTGPTLSVLGTLPIVGGWSVYARAGVLFADMNFKTGIGASSSDTSFASQNMLWGAGTQFDWGDHWSMRIDFQRFESVGELFEGGEADIDLLSLGVLFRI
jgi:opacity protein-like surface antigen